VVPAPGRSPQRRLRCVATLYLAFVIAGAWFVGMIVMLLRAIAEQERAA
jgi:hypothetical protein